GALHKLRALPAATRANGVVSASTGNHGLAISHAARLEGVGLTLFLPITVAEVKRRKLEALGVPLRFHGASCEKTEIAAREYAAGEGRTFVSPYNDLDIIRGQGTLGVEAAEDLPALEAVFVPVGGGGLVAGVGAYLKSVIPSLVVVGVEPENSAFMEASLRAGRLVEVEERETVADAVAGGIEPGSVTFPLCQAFVDRIVLVSEDAILRAMSLMSRHHGRMAEGAGALALAGLLTAAGDFRGRRVLCVVSGGNIDRDRFRELTVAVP
ncbi:MAG: pyridoxal-phosphate dependent enzyme, partial [Candidatus Aminicenantes bacterium]|nr:pyridoxal-phosphate dependent enzyme [Candidatus Aminicenantes bacterium]